jgi:hypothetical protein
MFIAALFIIARSSKSNSCLKSTSLF